MVENYNEFIGMYSDVYEDGFCSHMINEFERISDSRIVRNRKETEGSRKTSKDDLSVNLNMKGTSISPFNDRCVNQVFTEGLQHCFDLYSENFDILKDLAIVCSEYKMQKTCPGAGYHLWHCEQGNGEMARRNLVYMIYLNDVKEAGETEFLYQKLRIPPKENCMLIWPASYTHTHRGNVVHGNTAKYVITGWFHLE